MEKNRTARELAEIRMDDTRIVVYQGIALYKEELCKHLMSFYKGELAVYVKSSEADNPSTSTSTKRATSPSRTAARITL